MNLSKLTTNYLRFDRRLEDLNARWRQSPPAQERWKILRETYSLMLPHILQRRTNPYFLDWTYNRTPIEEMAWIDIRFYGLPLYPQVPALHYFLDFADPVNQIAVELDGAAYHEHSRDLARDKALWEQGWRVFRIPGKRSLASGIDIARVMYDARDSQEAMSAVIDWGTSWSEGFFWALGRKYYRKHGLDGLSAAESLYAAEVILLSHQLVDFPLTDDEEE